MSAFRLAEHCRHLKVRVRTRRGRNAFRSLEWRWTVLFALVLLLGATQRLIAEELDLTKLPPPLETQIDFKSDIRPLFEANCYGCHGPDKQKSDFRLDLKASAFKGGQHGPAIVPGKSAESRLIHFVGGLVEDIKMPPPSSGSKPLTNEEIGKLRAWIDQGASWPEGDNGTSAGSKGDLWVFKPAVRPALPPPSRTAWARNEIDRFILDALERQHLAPSPEADRRTLIRRVTFDVTGLPPTPEEVAAFLNDSQPNAYEWVVDRLLGSPRYGERWARHWLDAIHYGETHGYDKDKTRPNAWPYRDYVIRAFNSDKPYSHFVEEQIAGDVLFPEDPDGVLALGFLAAGPWDFVGHVELPESKTDGLIARYNDRDDMLMTTMSTFQSLTVHCARCHDHKFDPIAQEEYYGLQAVFAGVDRAERWFDRDADTFKQRKQLLKEQKAVEARLDTLNTAVIQTSPKVFKLIDARREELRKQLAALPKPGSEESPSNGYHSEIAAGPDTIKWVQVDLGQAISIQQIRLIPARPTDFADNPGFGFPVRFRVEVADGPEFENPSLLLDQTGSDYSNPGDAAVHIPGSGQRGRVLRITATRLWERTRDYVFALAEVEVESGGQNAARNATIAALDSIESGRWAKTHLVDGFGSRKRLPGPETASDLAAAAQRASLQAEIQQLAAERQVLVAKLVDPHTISQFAETESRLAKLAARLAELPTPFKVYAAASDFSPSGSFKPSREPRAVHVLRRGEVKQPMHLAKPGALSCLPGLEGGFQLGDASDEGNRRAALAKWITTPANILTRRSIVNRIWQNHFGRGIVETANDFGHMGALPTHPELLDWLAYWFLDQGESMKKLHRLLLTSATYRQASAHRPECARVDAENRYLWRMNRARLDAESLRDSILYIAGRLDLSMGGPSVQQFFFKDDHSPVYDYSRFDIENPAALRRSVYRFIVRSVPDPFMETMDCPDPSLLTPKRNITVTALQALALLNDPIVLRQAEAFSSRLAEYSQDLAAQIAAAYELALSRPPNSSEAGNLLPYAQEHGATNFCRVLFNTSEFMFVD